MKIPTWVAILGTLCMGQTSWSEVFDVAGRLSPAVEANSQNEVDSPQEISFDLTSFTETNSNAYYDNACGCEGACNSGCCDSGCGGGLLGYGCFTGSDHCFDDFISPMTNPVFFEDPRTLTEIRFLFIDHKLPSSLGGDVQLVAAQVRLALSERLSLIATKDGYIFSHGAPHKDGWADINLGLKYNLLRDPCCRRIVSAGLVYELPVGSTQALQGNGDGEFNIFLSAAAEYGYGWHYMTTTGFRLPMNRSEESSVWYWSNHLDHRIGCTNFYGFIEANWFHWMGSGDQTALAGIEGVDLYNFGSTGVAGNDIVTGAIGLKYKPHGNSEIGVAYETHLTDRRDVFENRAQLDWIFRF